MRFEIDDGSRPQSTVKVKLEQNGDNVALMWFDGNNWWYLASLDAETGKLYLTVGNPTGMGHGLKFDKDGRIQTIKE